MGRATLELTFRGCPGSDSPHLSVDGLSPAGPNLSHWPGNRTPPRWKADLSTGICLAFARAAEADRAAFLGGVRHVLNDHFDTDGFLSLLAVLRPEVVLAREELCLAVAATGDFEVFVTPRALAVERTVAGIAGERSPVAAEFAATGPERDLRRYRWLIDHAEEVLDHPERFAAIHADEVRAICAEVERCKTGALARRLHPALGLALVETAGPVHRTTLNTLAGAWRVLHVVPAAGGATFRYHDRSESWFDVVTVAPPRRVDLAGAAARLQALEGEAGDGARWCADPPTDPVPELYFGLPAPQGHGEVSRELRPSRLSPAAVLSVLAEHLAAEAAP